MFHLVKKYPNRKLYDILLKRFIRQEELAEMIIAREEVRVEDSDTHIDITPLEVNKALSRYIRKEHVNEELAEVLRRGYSGAVTAESEPDDETAPDGEEDIQSYIPAEIRLLTKGLDYLLAARDILRRETPFDRKLHFELDDLYRDFTNRLVKLKKKFRIV